MTAFLQAVAGALVAVILCGVLARQGKDMTVLLGLAVCGMILVAAIAYLEPVVEFLRSLQETAGLDDGMFQVILKSVGIGMTAQIASMICADSGNGAIGKAVETLAAAVILWLSLPMMTALLELVQQMVGKV